MRFINVPNIYGRYITLPPTFLPMTYPTDMAKLNLAFLPNSTRASPTFHTYFRLKRPSTKSPLTVFGLRWCNVMTTL